MHTIVAGKRLKTPPTTKLKSATFWGFYYLKTTFVVYVAKIIGFQKQIAPTFPQARRKTLIQRALKSSPPGAFENFKTDFRVFCRLKNIKTCREWTVNHV